MPISKEFPLGEVAEDILGTLQEYEVMTSHALLWHIRVNRGLTADHGYLVLKKLMTKKPGKWTPSPLVVASRTHPELGPATHRMLTLSRAGSLLMGGPNRPAWNKSWPTLQHLCQRAHVHVDYVAAGWGTVPAERVWPFLIAMVKESCHGRTLTAEERQDRDAVLNWPAPKVVLHAYASRAAFDPESPEKLGPTGRGELRLVVPAYAGSSLRRLLTGLPGEALAAVSRFVPLQFLITAADVTLLPTVEATIKNWAQPDPKRIRALRKRGIKTIPMRKNMVPIHYSTRCHDHYTNRPNPKLLGGLTATEARIQRQAMTTRWP